MKQLILKQGDLVKCIGLTQALSDSGFQLDGLYEVKRLMATDILYVEAVKGRMVAIVDKDGLTDHADDFTKHQCPIVLPRGV